MTISVSKDLQRVQKLSQDAIKDYGRSKPKDARKSASKLLNHKKATAYYLFQVAIAAYNAKDLDASLKLHNAALDLPEEKNLPRANIFISRGLVQTELGTLDAALNDFSSALSLSPNDARAYNNRAITFQKFDKKAEAVADLEKALDLDPAYLNAALNLINHYQNTDETDKAIKLINEKQSLFNDNVDFQTAAGKVKRTIRPLEALIHFRQAAHLEPTSRSILGLYADAFTNVGNLKNFDGLDHDLLLLLSSDEVNWKRLNRIIPQHLTAHPDFRVLKAELKNAIAERRDANLNFGQAVKFMTNNVLLAAMKRVRLTDPLLEKLLETFRRQTLLALASDIQLDDALKKILLSILIPFAKYSFMAEYIFEENDFEKQTKEKLSQQLSENNEFTIDNALKFVLICSYEEPYRNNILIECAHKWEQTPIAPLNELIASVVSKPLYEKELLSTFPKLTVINDAISQTVREMYEENPYPRWDHFPYQGSTSLPQQLVNVLPVLNGELPNIPMEPEILIAGCGTGQQPISTSYAFPSAKITAIDLSLASLAYAKRKTEEIGIKNITFGQADIMELRSLGKKFDSIECGGVLHHMHDPIAGWQVLVDILKDDGFMQIALYSEIGRQDIVAGRAFIKENQYGTKIADIRACRKHIMSLPDEHPVKQISSHGDFFTMSTCRDLIFHIQEHRFTIPELEQAFEKLGLEFLGFELSKEYMKEAYIRAYPEDKYRTNLKNWHEFETNNPRTFSAMYQFWVRKKK